MNSANHSDKKEPSPIASSKAVKHPEKPREGGPPPGTGRCSFDPPYEHKEISCNKKRDWIDKTALTFEAVGLLVVIVYAISTIFIWCANKKAADAAKMAANTARETLLASERPWVGFARNTLHIRAVNVYRIGTSENEHRTRIDTVASVDLENFGNSPAIRVSPIIFYASFSTSIPDDWKTAACRFGAENISKEGKRTYFIMPKSTVSVSQENTQTTAQDVSSSHTIWLIGCTVYQDSLNAGLHHTVVVFGAPHSPKVPIDPKSLRILTSYAN